MQVYEVSLRQVPIFEAGVNSIHHQQDPSLGLDHSLDELPQPHFYLTLAYVACYQLVAKDLLRLDQNFFFVFLEPFTSLIAHLHYIEVVDDVLFCGRFVFFGRRCVLRGNSLEYFDLTVRFLLGL